jgi:excisionase family DNA binding protein
MDSRSTLTVSEIAADLGLGRVKIYAMLQSNVIPNIRVGRTWIVTRNAYEAWKSTCGMPTAAPRRMPMAS